MDTSKPITDQLVASGHAMHAATLVVNSPEVPTASLLCRASVNTPKAPCVLGIVSRPTRGDCRSPRAAVRAPKASESRSLLTGRAEPALVGFLAHVSGPTIGGMSEAKNPQDKCEECGHPRNVHHDYGTPHCIPTAEPGQPALACSCLEFAEPMRSSRHR